MKKELQNPVPQPEIPTLSAEELDFIVTKLRQSSYVGTEFEGFYIVMVKLSGMREALARKGEIRTLQPEGEEKEG